jgi:hypothetical protein
VSKKFWATGANKRKARKLLRKTHWKPHFGGREEQKTRKRANRGAPVSSVCLFDSPLFLTPLPQARSAQLNKFIRVESNGLVMSALPCAFRIGDEIDLLGSIS